MIGDSQEGARPAAGAGLFATTRWSVVLRAQDKSVAAFNTLCQTYSPALIKWLTIRGYKLEDAEDHIQGFVLHMLERDSLNNVAQAKGKFRTFLLQCLRNYLCDQRDKQTAEKRGSGKVIQSLDETDDVGQKLLVPALNDGPDLECDRAWAQAVGTTVLCRLKDQFTQQGHSALWSELEPVMFKDNTASPYKEIGARLAIPEGRVKIAAHRLRKRFLKLFREEVKQTVGSQEDLEEEVRYLMELFAR